MSKNVFLVLALCLVGGLYANHQRIERWFNPPPPAVIGAHSVVLYATSWCGYCAQAREFFVSNRIAYREIDVETSDEGRAEFHRLGGNGVPVIVIDKSNVMHGFDPDAVLAALEH